MPLQKGINTLKWTNVKGGGLNLDALVLTNDPKWKPDGQVRVPPTDGHHAFWFQAEAAKEIREPKDGRTAFRFDNWSNDRVSVSNHNLFWNSSGDVTMQGGPAEKDFAKWKTLFKGKYDNQSWSPIPCLWILPTTTTDSNPTLLPCNSVSTPSPPPASACDRIFRKNLSNTSSGSLPGQDAPPPFQQNVLFVFAFQQRPNTSSHEKLRTTTDGLIRPNLLFIGIERCPGQPQRTFT